MNLTAAKIRKKTATLGLTAAIAACCFALASCGTAGAPPANPPIRTGSKMPWGMAFNADRSMLYVANYLAYTVDVYKTPDMVIHTTIPVYCKPRHLAFNSDYTELFVSHAAVDFCANSQVTFEKKSGGWVSVINIAQNKVTGEISLNDGSSDLTGPTQIVFDPAANIFYVTDSKNYKIAVIDAESKQLLNHMSLFDYMNLTRIIVDTDRGINYGFATTTLLVPFVADSPAANTYKVLGRNWQDIGYCAGDIENRNGCACSKNANCNSNSCDTGAELYNCKYNCPSSNAPGGCACDDYSDCAYGICDTGVCNSVSALRLDVVRGVCDPSTTHCLSLAQAHLENLGCRVPWDALPLSDNTIYVTCNGLEADKNIDQPVIRILADGPGLASSASSVITEATLEKACREPTELATDPSERYVFIACYGDNSIVVVDPADGDVLKTIALPGPPIDLIASDSFLYATLSTVNEIHRFPISSLPASGGVTPSTPDSIYTETLVSQGTLQNLLTWLQTVTASVLPTSGTAADTFTLTCTVSSGTARTLEGRCNTSGSWSAIVGNTKECRYTFAGSYTPECRINGKTTDKVDAPVVVTAPPIIVSASVSPTSGTTADTYTLTCTVSGEPATTLEGRCKTTDSWSTIASGNTKSCNYSTAGSYTPGCRAYGTITDNVDTPVTVTAP